MAHHHVNQRQATAWLRDRFGQVDAVEPLGGGFWCSAYGFSHAGRELVVRFGDHLDWFEADRAAMSFDSPALPVPEVLDVGRTESGAYALSVRHRGVKLEDVRPEQSDAAGPMLSSLLGALQSVPASSGMDVGWSWRPRRPDIGWRKWLTERLADDPNPTVGDWRTPLSNEPEANHTFHAAESRILELLDVCPERRDLVHGDLLHANVLVTEDASRPTAVFSWKCSLRGDFLYDVAWCTFWSPWHEGIAAADPWRRIRGESSLAQDPELFTHAAERHHCYELHIGATHLGWNAWIGDITALRQVAAHLSNVLQRGPLALSPG